MRQINCIKSRLEKQQYDQDPIIHSYNRKLSDIRFYGLRIRSPHPDQFEVYWEWIDKEFEAEYISVRSEKHLFVESTYPLVFNMIKDNMIEVA